MDLMLLPTMTNSDMNSAGDTLSVGVYAATDSDYTIYGNSAGFSVSKLRTKVAFSAAKPETQPVTAAGWTESVGPYSTTGYKGLFGRSSISFLD